MAITKTWKRWGGGAGLVAAGLVAGGVLAGTVGASLIVISWELSEVAWLRAEEGGRVLVAVPDEDDSPLDSLAVAR